MAENQSKVTVRVALLASVTAFALCYLMADGLPDPKRLDPRLFAAPRQTGTAQAPFFRTAEGISYKVIPLFEYDLYGLVVSEHDSHAFVDYVHREAGDHLNVIDLCVVWGDDARAGAYRHVRFSSGQFTCYVTTVDRESAAQFDIYQMSNNHLLTEEPRLARLLRGVHVGDEVHFHGWLSEYEHDHGFHFHRGTSITRFDTGDGACETVYVTRAEILHSYGRPWRIGQWLAATMFLASIFAWCRLPLSPD